MKDEGKVCLKINLLQFLDNTYRFVIYAKDSIIGTTGDYLKFEDAVSDLYILLNSIFKSKKFK